MEPAPGGLEHLQSRTREVRLVAAADWYLVAAGTLDRVGTGDLSLHDLESVAEDIAGRYGERACFVAVERPRQLEEVLANRIGTKRITWAERLGRPLSPKLRAVARGARLAVVGDRGIFWVDGERLLKEGELAPLPWTVPPVSLVSIRPARLRRALEEAVGPGGPRRARLA